MGRFLDRHGVADNPLQGLSLDWTRWRRRWRRASVPVAAVSDPERLRLLDARRLGRRASTTSCWRGWGALGDLRDRRPGAGRRPRAPRAMSPALRTQLAAGAGLRPAGRAQRPLPGRRTTGSRAGWPSLADMLGRGMPLRVRRAGGQRRLRHARQPGGDAAGRHRAAQPVAGRLPGRPRGARRSPTACSCTSGASSAAAPQENGSGTDHGAGGVVASSWARGRPAASSASSRASAPASSTRRQPAPHRRTSARSTRRSSRTGSRSRRDRHRPGRRVVRGAAAAEGVRVARGHPARPRALLAAGADARRGKHKHRRHALVAKVHARQGVRAARGRSAPVVGRARRRARDAEPPAPAADPGARARPPRRHRGPRSPATTRTRCPCARRSSAFSLSQPSVSTPARSGSSSTTRAPRTRTRSPRRPDPDPGVRPGRPRRRRPLHGHPARRRHLLFCPLPEHEDLGMRAALTVR